MDFFFSIVFLEAYKDKYINFCCKSKTCMGGTTRQNMLYMFCCKNLCHPINIFPKLVFYIDIYLTLPTLKCIYIYMYKIFSFVMSKIIEFNKFIIFSHLYIYLSSLTISFYFKTFFFLLCFVTYILFYSFQEGEKNLF